MKGSKTYGSRSIDILGKDDTLSLNDEEVDELVDISDHSVKSLSWDSVVLAGADLGSQAVVQEGLSGDLSGDGDAQNHPGKLESPAEDIEVPNREDDSGNSGIGNGRST